MIPEPTVLDAILRWAIVVLGLSSGALVLMVRHLHREKTHNMGLRMLGGALVCLSVAFGSLGVIFQFDTVWRLPFLAVALLWCAAGAAGEYVDLKRRGKGK